MKHKFISTQSNELLTFFNQINKNCFDYSEANIVLKYLKSGNGKKYIRNRISNYFHNPMGGMRKPAQLFNDLFWAEERFFAVGPCKLFLNNAYFCFIVVM